MDYLVIDVETANPDYSSICQIGVVDVREGVVFEKISYLVDPEDYFDAFNVSIHGIDEERVRGAPTFAQVYEGIAKRLGTRVVVHHGPFDRVAINRAVNKNQLQAATWRWLDNQRVVRRTWEHCRQSGYGLEHLAGHFGIPLQHHDALHDAVATEVLFRRALTESGLSIDEWLIRVSQRPSSKRDIVGDGDSTGLFYGETIVFTGEMGVNRSEASKIAREIGFRVEGGVTKRTTVLCAGRADVARLAGYQKTEKHRKAETLAANGQAIRIISEEDFWSMVNVT